MRKQQIVVPTESPLTVENMLNGLANKMLDISFDDFQGNSVYPISSSVTSGTNDIEVEMSDDTKFVVTIEEGGQSQ